MWVGNPGTASVGPMAHGPSGDGDWEVAGPQGPRGLPAEPLSLLWTGLLTDEGRGPPRQPLTCTAQPEEGRRVQGLSPLWEPHSCIAVPTHLTVGAPCPCPAEGGLQHPSCGLCPLTVYVPTTFCPHTQPGREPASLGGSGSTGLSLQPQSPLPHGHINLCQVTKSLAGRWRTSRSPFCQPVTSDRHKV